MSPGGRVAEDIAFLWWAMLAASGLAFAIVMGFFLTAVLRPGRLAQVPVGRWLVWGGFALPLTVLTLLVCIGFVVGERAIMRGAEPLVIEAEARQWSWTFRYADRPDLPPEENGIAIPVGQPVEFRLTSADVIHAFWVPRLAGKLDAIPGHVNRLRLVADDAGEFGGVCAEYCGSGHAMMPFLIRAVPVAEFERLTGGSE
ncbi:cytochrome B561 [Haematobacter missouriensis]|nr:cytochrome B561 [Haematobacter missouriensis]